ncbi:MAG: 3'(2'),5'-bisphosphate nucleotidase CysQ [Deltaproteobacteria bacterium]|nr:3'(2'),5'-bisphosphate nucleotidase CysQ [Deltaproteobacteria bacterium]
MDLSLELEVALDAARHAAARVMEVYATEFRVDWKGAGDPVTQADREANTLIAERLLGRFPQDHLCAEEDHPETASAQAALGGRCWFVDPLDGTREFVDRNGDFAVMVGLAVDGAARLGVVLAPAWGRALVGIVGVGAWSLAPDGTRTPLSVRDVPVGEACLVASRSHRSPAVDAAARALGVGSVRPCGSVGLKAALVAAGEATLYLHAGDGPKLWDTCAPEALAVAAGAVVTDAYGEPLRYATARLAVDRGIVVAPASLGPRAARALREAIDGGM